MTGYGVAGFENEQLVIQVEVRTLNSKMLDLSSRSPRQFADKEAEIRNRAQAILDRGKVSISIDFLVKGNQNLPVQLNEDLYRRPIVRCPFEFQKQKLFLSRKIWPG